MCYGWSKEFLEAGKRRLAGDTARAATSGEVKDIERTRVRHRLPLYRQHLNLPELRNNILRLEPLPCHLTPPRA
jgi:hypothetical protein